MSSGEQNVMIKDHLMEFDYEGKGSPAGSVGCCSLLESDDDLKFLDDLGMRFKTLAEICGGKTVSIEKTQVDTPLPNASDNNIQMSEPNLVTSEEMSYSSKVQPNYSTTEQTLVSKTEHSEMRKSTATVREGMTSMQKGIAHPNQMLVLNQQQPIYLTAAPMLQPMHYVVQQPLQNAMVLAEAPGPNVQHMIMVNGTDIGSSQGVLVQGQTMIPSPQTQSLGTMLVDSSGFQTENLIHAGNFSGSQNMMVVESNVSAGTLQRLNGNQVSIIQGGTMLNEQSGSQTILKIGGSKSS